MIRDFKKKIKAKSSHKALLLAYTQRLSVLIGSPLPLKTVSVFPLLSLLIPLPASIFLCLLFILFNLSRQGLALYTPGWPQTILLSLPCLWPLLAFCWLLFWLHFAKSSVQALLWHYFIFFVIRSVLFLKPFCLVKVYSTAVLFLPLSPLQGTFTLEAIATPASLHW